MELAKQVWSLLAYAWQARDREASSPIKLHPVDTHRSRFDSPPPDTSKPSHGSDNFQRLLADAQAPIRWYGDPKDIYLA